MVEDDGHNCADYTFALGEKASRCLTDYQPWKKLTLNEEIKLNLVHLVRTTFR